MTPKRFPPTDPREWLRRARSNLAHARRHDPDVELEDLCFDAQQCAEKAIKAVFIHRGEKFKYTHEIDDLLDQLAKNGLIIPKYARAAYELTKYAVLTRYPGMVAPVKGQSYRRAVRLASAVLRWAERQIAPPGKKSGKP
jgi:HEPN domain-containing protein